MTRGRILTEHISRAELVRRTEEQFGDWIKAWSTCPAGSLVALE